MAGSKKSRIVGWILSILLACLFVGAGASTNFPVGEERAKELAKLGYTPELMQKIGAVQIICAVLFLIPQTSFLGAILLTGYLGGATATHVRVGEPFFAPVIVGIVVWIAYGLRRSEIFSLLCCSKCTTPAEKT